MTTPVGQSAPTGIPVGEPVAGAAAPDRLGDLGGAVALVTGAGRGIGRAVALELARHGADVAVVARSATEVEATAEAVRHLGRRSFAVTGDVTDPGSVDRAAGRALDELGTVDILVNNAGSMLFKPLVPLPGLRPGHLPDFAAPTTDAEWQGQLGVHLSGAFYFMRALGPHMLDRGYGRVINIGSVAVHRSARFSSAYEAAKGGLSTLTRSVGKEWARHGVTVNCIAAGHFHTELSRELHETEDGQRWLGGRIPMRRSGELWEIGQLVVYLAGPWAGFLTGQVIDFDGGESL